MRTTILGHINSSAKKGKKLFALLVDPDKFDVRIIDFAEDSGTDLFLVGGSLITNGNFEECISSLKRKSKIPVMIFPGNTMQISKKADGILFLSLISGRNPELLIGNHVLAASVLKQSQLEVIPTGYILVDGGTASSTSYMSNTMPIPAHKPDIASSTAIAGELLGMKLIYLEAGSGAKDPVNKEMISAVKKNCALPLIVGGGIRTGKDAAAACKAGADIIVVGTGAEKNFNSIKEIARAIHAV